MNNNILNNIYIGNIKKNLKGGIKIINDSEDNNIIKKRNMILNELSNIFKGGKDLMYEDIPFYVKALEGKYIRNKICKGGAPQCKEACNFVKKSYKKLIKKSFSEFSNPDLLKIIQGGSPYLFKKVGLKDKFNGGNSFDKKIDEIAIKIMDLDNECNPSNCKSKLMKFSQLRNELNKYWQDSTYCSREENCANTLSKYIMSLTPNLRAFKESVNTNDVETYTLTPKEIIEKFNSPPRETSGGYHYYNSQYGGNSLEQLRIEINELRRGY
jgi:hypothetical protein